jgi:2-polyprenyl-3-methyl-5-hydroxy-6-metoxy-1,4-benzoquinol methylase
MNRLREKLIEQYASHYNRVNADIDPASLPPRAYEMMELTFGPALRSVPAGGRVVDVGCGTGFLLYWLTKRGGVKPVGVDASPSQIEVLRKHLPSAEVYCADGLAFMKEHPGEFHALFCTDVLEHIPEDLLLDWVETARAALAPGGVFVCRVPNASNLTGSQARYIDLTHYRCFTVQSLEQLLTAGGFRKSTVLPIRTGHFTGRVRLAMERLLHKAVYTVCGASTNGVFTTNLVASAEA